MHSLGENQLCTAVVAHLGRPCIAGAERLLGDLASAAALNVVAKWVALRRSSPGLVQKLECLAAEVQTAIQVPRDYWVEMAAVPAEQRKARTARIRMVRSSIAMPTPWPAEAGGERLAAPRLRP